ncbi:hypothetical protein VNO77_36738 [Canavalia gladiata]|uniref:Late embryogenesis abundant protein LEA-2 subgroup domain-containing protein n=1 Tax=Canavalia gladiata TaxID=3824 RepID=A0AAN9PWR8_CANGL
MDRNRDNSPMTKCSCKDIFLKLRSMLVLFFVVIMTIIGIAWLVMHPHGPSFGVTSLSVTNFTVSNNKDSQLKGKYEVELAIRNPNKVKALVVINRCSMLVLYDQVWRSMASVQQHVFLEKRANRSVKIDLEVEDSSKKVVVVPQDLIKDWNKRLVNFNIKFSVEVRFEARFWPSKDKLLDVDCKDLDVEFFSPNGTGRLLGVGKDCHIANE